MLPFINGVGFVAQRYHNYMILKVLIIFDPKLNLFKSDAYIFMQQSLILRDVIKCYKIFFLKRVDF
jgi:hypothetical protein